MMCKINALYICRRWWPHYELLCPYPSQVHSTVSQKLCQSGQTLPSACWWCNTPSAVEGVVWLPLTPTWPALSVLYRRAVNWHNMLKQDVINACSIESKWLATSPDPTLLLVLIKLNYKLWPWIAKSPIRQSDRSRIILCWINHCLPANRSYVKLWPLVKVLF